MNFIKNMKNKHKGERCFIVATGPSLAYNDLSFLKNEFVISVNLAPLTLNLLGIQPQIIVVADKLQYPTYEMVLKKLTYNKDIIKVIVASACDTFPKKWFSASSSFVKNN